MIGNEQYQDYTQSTVESVYQRGAWHNWYRIRRWAEREGAADGELAPDEVRHLAEDLRVMQQDGVAFTESPRLAYQLLRNHCPHRPRR